MRAVRLSMFIFGITLFALALARGLYMPPSEHNYVTIYGQQDDDPCCYTYMVNPDKDAINRVRLGSNQQPGFTNSISASGEWRFSYEPELRGGVTVRFLPPNGQGKIVDVAHLPGYIWHMQWSTQSDRVYYLSRNARQQTELFTAAPDDPVAKRLSNDVFSYVRTMNEQPLPTTDYYFLPLMAWTVLFLFVTGGLPILWKRGLGIF